MATAAKNTPAPTEREISFTFDRSTKNTHRFAEQTEDGASPVIGNLYVQRSVFPTGNAPESLTVRLAW